MFPAKSLYDVDARVVAASDYPVTPYPNPMSGIYLASERTVPESMREGCSEAGSTLDPREAITIAQAF